MYKQARLNGIKELCVYRLSWIIVIDAIRILEEKVTRKSILVVGAQEGMEPNHVKFEIIMYK